MTGESDIASIIIKVRALIESKHFTYQNEHELQLGIETTLGGALIPYEREFRLTATERPDFLVWGCLAIEVKVDGGPSTVLRQLERYARYEVVEGIMLVTRRMQHLTLPATILDKPLSIVPLTQGSR
jgi:hypothetical protein